jgi:hypothetical protein
MFTSGKHDPLVFLLTHAQSWVSLFSATYRIFFGGMLDAQGAEP